MTTVEHRYLFIPDEQETAAHKQQLSGVTPVGSWDEVAAALTA
jgi:hypothetical protein